MQQDGSSKTNPGSINSIRTVQVVQHESLARNTGRQSHAGLWRVLTYGPFDPLHFGHLRLLQRAASLGDYLIVALSTDEFNASKGNQSFYPYEVRREMLEAVRYVDLVIPEDSWGQKRQDIETCHVDTVCMGGDWRGDPQFREPSRPLHG